MQSRKWLLGSTVIGIVFACSGNPEVTSDNGFDSGGKSNGSSGGSSANSGATADSIDVGSGASNGKGGKGSNGSGADGGEEGDVPDASYPDDVTFEYDPEGTGEEDACANVTGEATLVKRPMDIIVSIDNSGSMEGEIHAVQDRINTDFAEILNNPPDGIPIDYRVILVSRYGHIDNEVGSSNFPVCIGPPLGTQGCGNDPNNYPTLVNNDPIFFHYSADIASTDMWCRLLQGYASQDELPVRATSEPPFEAPATEIGWAPVAPNGYSAWLREEAFKIIVGISDDRIACDPPSYAGLDVSFSDGGGEDNDDTDAKAFDQVLRTLSPEQFGAYNADTTINDAQRNYRYYAIVGLAAKAGADATVPYEPGEAIVTDICTNGGGNNDGVARGYAHQYLAKLTGGLRYSNCLNSDFDAIFNAIAQGVIEGSKASCDYDVPTPTGGILDPEHTKVSYEPGNGDDAMLLDQFDDLEACGTGDGFYFSDDFAQIHLCPTTCTTVQADEDANVSLDFGCQGS